MKREKGKKKAGERRGKMNETEAMGAKHGDGQRRRRGRMRGREGK